MLYYNTVSPLLKDTLLTLMAAEEFKTFRLVGGTSLSLQLGHRMSVDIDLFSDSVYGSIDFLAIDSFLRNNYTYVDHFADILPAMGKGYSLGTDKDNTVKVDVYYTDPYIQPVRVEDTIRLASIEEIIAMKLDIVQRGGRKKDFWDLHELHTNYDVESMLQFHQQRYEYNHDRSLILNNLTDFSLADNDFDPICLRGKYWEFIKEDFVEFVSSVS